MSKNKAINTKEFIIFILTVSLETHKIKDSLTTNANCSASRGIENAFGIHFNFVLASSTFNVMLLVPGSLLT